MLHAVVCAWIESLAALKPGEYDLRNQGCVEFAKAIVQTEAFRNRYIPYV
jgi:hypothetical protein